MKKIYISERQKKHLKKAIAAQDQVGGKVNAGIMDAVAGGAMCETTDVFGGDAYSRSESITFVTPTEGGSNKVYSSDEIGITHGRLLRRLAVDGVISYFPFNDKDCPGINPYMTGRYWVNSNTISLYRTPINESDRNYTLSAIQQLGLDPNTIDVDFWDTNRALNIRSQFVLPFKWFMNGTIDDLLQMGVYLILKRNYGLYQAFLDDFKTYLFDREGNIVDNTLKEVNDNLIYQHGATPHKEIAGFKPNIQPLIMYKQFKLRLDKNGNNLAPGYVFPLYVNTEPEGVSGKQSVGLEIGKWYKSGEGECWLDTKNNRLYTKGKGYGTDGNTIDKLAYRPGWHLTTTPWGNQRGDNKVVGGKPGTGNNYLNTRNSEVWAKVEICVDIDATERAMAMSSTPADQCLQNLGDREYYKYKTNSNASDDQAWYIVDMIRIVDILDDDTVDSTNDEYYNNLLANNPGKKINSDPYNYTKELTNDIPYWKMPRTNGKRYSRADIEAMGYKPAEPTKINESAGVKVSKWYRGFNKGFGVLSDTTPHLLWITDDLEYAKEYGDAVMEYQIDFDKCNGSIYDLPDGVDYYDGPDEETANELLKQGINSYCFYANDDSSYCMCLWSKEPIVSEKLLDLNEGVDMPEYEVGFEKGGFEPYGHVINESHEWCDSFEYTPYLKSIANFLQDNGINVKPFPRVKLHREEQEGLYVKTGYYDPDERKVHLFIADRHPKDVLRSFTHEMIHHSQNLKGMLKGYKGDTLDGDETLQKLESEAYLKGNIYFRKWTEELRPKFPNTKQPLNESIQDIYNIQEDSGDYGVSTLLNDFFQDKKKGVAKKQWRTIPAEQYKNLTEKFMTSPMMAARIPENVIYDWFENIIVPNAFSIEYITELAGHTQYFPYDEVNEEFEYWRPGMYEITDYESGYNALEAEGFYEWCSLPDGSDGWSDYGIGPIFNELANYKPGMEASNLLVLINRVLHISHCRGDLASAFIEGGSQTCSAISGIIRESIEETKWNGNGEEWKGIEPVQNPPAELYHASPKYNRKSIMELGLYPDCGEEYKDWWNYEGPNGEYPDDEELPEMVFLSDKPYTWYNNISQNGEIDIYQIDVSKLDLGNLFYDPDRDQRNNGAYCYTNVIPPSALKLYGQNIEENFDIEELSTPDSIDLSSFDIKDQLNPRFWKNGRIDSRVRTALLDIADDFIDYLDVPWTEPKDIIMTGSLANYNWSQEHSDVDLHIVINFKDVDDNVKLVKEYFDSKRRLWNEEHQNITIAGFQVELYVQDEHEPHASTGVYSLDKDEWLVRPNIKNFDLDYDKDAVKEKVAEYMNKIDDLCDEYDDSVADCDLSELHEKAEKLFDDIKNERRNGFEHGGGEYNVGNLIFKSLRRNGYIGKLSKIRTDTYDDMKSIYNENNEAK